MHRRKILSVDGDDLVAVHHEADSDRWIVFSHGFLSDKEGSYESRAGRAVEEGFNAIRFDHRGCGESDLSFPEQTLSTRLADIQAVLDSFSINSCLLFGSSFGGKVALHTAAVDDRVQAVAARAPVTYNHIFDKYRPSSESGGQDIDHDFSLPPTFFDDFDAHPFEQITDDITVPLCLFHGTADETVPIGATLEAIAALETNVTFHQFAGEGHRFSRTAENRLQNQLVDWVHREIRGEKNKTGEAG